MVPLTIDAVRSLSVSFPHFSNETRFRRFHACFYCSIPGVIDQPKPSDKSGQNPLISQPANISKIFSCPLETKSGFANFFGATMR
jgi:hypothetical protein